MRISTFWYCLKQGVINICRNIWFSLASVATISACIFLFCLFYAIIMNVQNVVHNAETTVGITVFFKEDLTETQIEEIGNQIRKRPEIKTIEFTSAAKAWEDFKHEYFSGMESLAEGFADDNPLAGSASYKIFLNDIETQDQVVTFIGSIPGVRKVNYSNSAAAGLSSFNKMIGLLSLVIIGVLLAVAMFLISNTISVAAAFRKHENQIMRLIGATNYMIRAPFVVEGVVIGLAGAALPLAGMYYLYKNAIVYVQQKFLNLSGIIVFLPIEDLMPSMMAVSLVLGAGIGFFVSFFTIRKHLKV
ncbi:FtsX-like permease family protein [Clostridium sp. MCC353]|uniref:permease-like cell division protein FtsX n=1 Tax=Clostridium sp. MCC353 TaxID=2592646 RepID=UPI001C026DAD|nr:permease-like cell division protein FtsX [Clostridium sp. MCC353]MBT9775752.1 FtsX-like permease family protein [Clostridium sp. MCC353]